MLYFVFFEDLVFWLCYVISMQLCQDKTSSGDILCSSVQVLQASFCSSSTKCACLVCTVLHMGSIYFMQCLFGCIF